jgi:RNA polymerase sigma-70 factor (ECF subfamily)
MTAGARGTRASGPSPAFERTLGVLFEEHFARIFRYLDRLSGDPDAAADAAQEAFVRLYRRGALPERPASWLITVALNQLRNALAQRSRRTALLSTDRGAGAHSDPSPSPAELAEGMDERCRVRRALDAMPERDRAMLLLRAEGYTYRELAESLRLHEASVGTLLARARGVFRAAYEEAIHAP